MTPLVSVVLPAFNAMPYLPHAVQSVLDQTIGDWELIIIDDGSTDGTSDYLATLADPRLITLRVPHSGNPAGVRNAGVAQARGPYIAFLDADDAWLPRKLEVQIPSLETSGCRWSYTATTRMDERSEPVRDPRIRPWVPYEGWILEALLRIDAIVAMPTVVAERALLLDVGGFDETLRYCSDYELWFRLALRGPVALVNEPLARVRVSTTSHQSNRAGVHQAWDRVYAKLADLVEDEPLRKLCLSRRVLHAATLSRIHTTRGEHGVALRTLVRAAPFAHTHAIWWRALARALIRPLVPASVIGTVRAARAR